MFKKIFGRPQLFYLALIAFGLALAFNLQLSNLSNLFKFLGASGNDIPLMWLGPPLTGLIVQPLIGQISDDTLTRYGKRRPFVVVWGIAAGLFFSLLPLFDSLMLALAFTWLIDCSLNGSNEAMRALTADTTSGAERTKAFAVQAVFAGVGAAIGASMPIITHELLGLFGVDGTVIAGSVPLNLKLSFFIGAMILVASVIFPMRAVKEKISRTELYKKQRKQKTITQRAVKIFKDIYYNIRKMPPKFRTICFTHAVTWAGVFMLWLYFSLTVAQNVYGLPVDADTAHNAHYAALLQKAALDSSLYFTVYQYISVGYALLLYFLPNHMRVKLIHAASLVIGGIGMVAVTFEHSSWAFIASMVAIGIMWGSMIVLPYSIATQVLPKGKLGVYLGVFNISITAPQILCGLLLGPVYGWLMGSHAAYMLLLGGLLVIVSAFLWFKIERAENKEVLSSARRLAYKLNLVRSAP